ncbi:VOC family protein [Arthrobacter sp. ISL-28]|uniref:VOC family protein n=1 Tax=Arthrobacter sp. ISL-28 TaxID=2819108 RepID=UPI001BEAEC64|nr:VOC family protein [Arthrobacter sp. ISL-28]MBT2523370.1 VOC family protein [Arthrobacter sp. ISL-28]
MKYHHMCIVVSEMDRALEVYRDFLGLQVVIDSTVPDARSAGDAKIVSGELMDKLFGADDATSRLVLLGSPEGLLLELQQPSMPVVSLTPPEQLTYASSGIREMAIAVTGIDDWFARATAQGYRTTTDEVWEFPGVLRSFLFFDLEGNLVQLCEDLSPITV